MGLLLSTRRSVMGTVASWTPAEATLGGYLPDHWYRSDGPLWQDAGVTPAVTDGDVVGRWEDKTSNADHLNQAVAGNKPTLQSGAGDTLNGHPVIRADGVNDYLQGAFTTGGQMNQPNTIFIVNKLDDAAVDDGSYHFLIDGDEVAKRQGLYQKPNPGADIRAMLANTEQTGGATTAGFQIWTALFNGASSQLWVDGVSAIGPANAGAQPLDALTVFTQYLFGGAWQGDVAEILLYDASLSDDDKDQVGQYLSARYNLTYTQI